MGNIRNLIWKTYLDRVYKPLISRSHLNSSRNLARDILSRIRKAKGRSIVNARMLKQIKMYAHEQFCSKAYWPWLACYTELRGEFIEGWVPDDYFRFKLLRAVNPVKLCNVSFIKSMDHCLFRDFAMPWIVFKTNDTLFDSNRNVIDEATALEKIRAAGKEIVLKRESGFGGKDIFFIRPDEITGEMLNRKFDFIVQEVASQHADIDAVYPGSVNTFRILTFLGFDSTVRVLYLILRIGRDGSRMDNISAGGRAVLFDDSGKCITNAHNEIGLEVETHHPRTGYEYKKLHLPFLVEAKRRCIESHYQYPYIRLIAWDVFIDRSGKPVLMEWNSKSPGIWTSEALIGPLWSMEELQKNRTMVI